MKKLNKKQFRKEVNKRFKMFCKISKPSKQAQSILQNMKKRSDQVKKTALIAV